MSLTMPLSAREKVFMLSIARKSGLSDAQLDQLREAINMYPERIIAIYNDRPRYDDMQEELTCELSYVHKLSM